MRHHHTHDPRYAEFDAAVGPAVARAAAGAREAGDLAVVRDRVAGVLRSVADDYARVTGTVGALRETMTPDELLHFYKTIKGWSPRVARGGMLADYAISVLRLMLEGWTDGQAAGAADALDAPRGGPARRNRGSRRPRDRGRRAE